MTLNDTCPWQRIPVGDTRAALPCTGEFAACLECPLELEVDNDISERLMAHPRLKWELWSQSRGGKGRQGSDLDWIGQNKNPGVRVGPGHDG